MDFEFDPAKDARVRAQRGFGFADAVAIFAGPVLERRDTRQEYGEVRIIATGQARGVFYTVRGAVRRIITAWPANEKERAAWHASR